MGGHGHEGLVRDVGFGEVDRSSPDDLTKQPPMKNRRLPDPLIAKCLEPFESTQEDPLAPEINDLDAP